MRALKGFGWSAGLLLATAVVQGEQRNYMDEFHQVLSECSLRYPANVVSPNADYELERESCYNRQVRTALLNLPPDSPERFSAALLVAPEYAESTFKTALTLGIDPYYATSRATATLPEKDNMFARVAIAYGADPSKTLTATAAGKQQIR